MNDNSCRPIVFGPLLVALVLGWVFMGACGGKGGGGGGGGSGSASFRTVASSTVGSDGGVVTDGIVEVVIPSGAFTHSTEVTLASRPANGYGDAAQTEEYRIDGIPADFGVSLEITVQVPEDAPADTRLVTLLPGYAPSALADTEVAAYPEGVRAGNSLTVRLDPTSAAAVRVASRDATAEAEPETLSVVTLGLSGWFTYTSEAGHFAVHFPVLSLRTQAESLAGYLEDAYAKIADLGFRYDARTAWPVDATLDYMDNEETYGAFIASKWSCNSSGLTFNARLVGEAESMRTTAGHEFFHFVQYLYDPRLQFHKGFGLIIPRQHWLNEAVSTWSEELFSDDEAYVSVVQNTNNTEPFYGFKNASMDSSSYGYGMAAFVKYLVENYSNDWLIEVYGRIREGGVANSTDPVLAIDNSIPEESLTAIWSAFIAENSAGDLYGLTSSDVISLLKGDNWRVASEHDTMKSFTANLPDLSAKPFLASFVNGADSVAATARLEVSVDDEYSDLTAFSYASQQPLERLAHGGGRLTIPNLQTLATAGRSVVVVATNSRALPPYDGTSSVTITLSIEEEQSDPPATAITSTFDGAFAESSDRWGIGPMTAGFASGWFLPRDVADYQLDGGNPDGYLRWQGDQRDWWYFVTYSSKYRGDQSFANGKMLRFALKTDNQADNPVPSLPLVVLSGADAQGDPLHLFQSQADHPEPGEEWTAYSLRLSAGEGWKVSSSSYLGNVADASAADILQVLATLSSLRIRGEYGSYLYAGGLDNVVLGGD